MDQIQVLQEAIALLWPELPALVGDNWPQFEQELRAYLTRLATAADAEQAEASYNQIRRLFFDHEAADARLIELLSESSYESLSFAIKGLESVGSAAPPSATAPPTVTRYTDIVAPAAVVVQTRFPLIVGLTGARATDTPDAQAIDAPVGAAIQVIITSTDFEVIGERAKLIVIQAEADSEPAVFYLRAPQAVVGMVLIEFWYAGQIVASNKRTIKAQAEATAVTNEHAAAQPLAITPSQAPYPDLILRVTTINNRLHYDLHFADTRLISIAGEPLRSDPETFRYNLIAELEALTNRRGREAELSATDRQVKLVGTGPNSPDGSTIASSPDEVMRELVKIGRRLYRDLFPPELRREYRRWRGQVRTLQITSDEPWLPWELIKPYDSEPGQNIVDDDFLCLQYEFTRWFTPAEPPAQVFRITSLACPAPTDSGLPAALTEQTMVRALAVTRQWIDLTPVASTKAAVEDLLNAEQPIQLWHFACHGNFARADPNHAPLLLQNNTALLPNDLVGPAQTRLQSDRPLVFLNACRVGSGGLALTGLGGWAKVLIGDCGVGALLAPMWTVDDQLASQFATVFYTTLLEPDKTFAQAARAARQAVRAAAPNNPIWLAYSIYAHPNARIQLNQATQPG